MRKPTVVSLFTGIAGLDLAYVAAGFEIIAQVEIDEFCQKVLRHHAPLRWPNARLFGDVRTFGVKDIPYADVIIGGFPCQDISSANPNGRGLDGARSGLWWEFARVIGEIRPRVVFLENVPNVTIRGGTAVIASLTQMGYDARWGVISAKDAGATHIRKRWFCVAYANGDGQPKSQSQPVDVCDIDGDGSAALCGSQEQLLTFAGSGEILRDMAVSQSIGRKAERVWRQRAETGDCTLLGNAYVFGLENPTQVTGVSGQRHPDNRSVAGKGVYQPELAGAAYGLSRWLDRLDAPSRPGRPQHYWEAPRQVLHPDKDWSDRVKATGNAVYPKTVYPIAVAVKALLDEVGVGCS